MSYFNAKLQTFLAFMMMFYSSPTLSFGFLMPNAVNDYSFFKAIQKEKKITIFVTTNGYEEESRKQLKAAVSQEVRQTLKLISKLFHFAGLRNDHKIEVEFILKDRGSEADDLPKMGRKKTYKPSDIDLYLAIENPNTDDGVKTNTMQSITGIAPLIYIKHDFAAIKSPERYASEKLSVWHKANDGVKGDTPEEQAEIDEIAKRLSKDFLKVPPLKSPIVTAVESGNALAEGLSRRPLLEKVREHVFVALGFSVPKTRITGHQFLPFLYREIGFFARQDRPSLKSRDSIINYFLG